MGLLATVVAVVVAFVGTGLAGYGLVLRTRGGGVLDGPETVDVPELAFAREVGAVVGVGGAAALLAAVLVFADAVPPIAGWAAYVLVTAGVVAGLVRLERPEPDPA